MANGKRTRRARARPEPARRVVQSFAEWFLRELVPLFRRPRRPMRRSARHLRNAGIEVLEAMRAFLDETIEWLREEKASPELRRIRVEE